ncbi:hypothetical protein RJ639_039994 [Escallonia herrerae]|uniref:Alcohol dehydrogenase-like C-terminal domain-containing protein n=1 Tax=Escallonia herrerae TaxID=1293975 RepID=A0AA89B956_9ASTE|nr:hypothetical protein RJ639_039994 [Escallonia herrerae]
MLICFLSDGVGMLSITAYVGFYEICDPKRGEKVFISAASGSVGQIFGQFGKLLGCYIVGSAGTKEKVDLLKNNFGFDEAFNYKKERRLSAIFFYIYASVIEKNDVKVANCYPPLLFGCLLDYYHRYTKFLDMVLSYIKQGKISYMEDTAEGLESAPAALVGLFSGRNTGK